MKRSKSVSHALLVLLLGLGISGPTKGLEGTDLLTKEDLAHEEADRVRGPALSSAIDDPNPWETYNQWMCFESSQVELESVGIKYDHEWSQMPQLAVTTLGQRFDISPDADQRFEADRVIETWRHLFDGSRDVCFFAAFLQYLDSDEDGRPRSLWILKSIKTGNGYWHVNSETSED